MNAQSSPLSQPRAGRGPYPQHKMDATTAAAVRRLLLPLRALPPAPRGAAAVSARPRQRSGPRRRVRVAPALASLDRAAVLLDAAAAVAAGGTGYSQASYYTSLGLFVLSVPGLWSLIKRSVKSKVPDPSLRPSPLFRFFRCLPPSLLAPRTRARRCSELVRARALAQVPCEQGAHHTHACVRCAIATLDRQRTVIPSR